MKVKEALEILKRMDENEEVLLQFVPDNHRRNDGDGYRSERWDDHPNSSTNGVGCLGQYGDH